MLVFHTDASQDEQRSVDAGGYRHPSELLRSPRKRYELRVSGPPHWRGRDHKECHR